MSDLTNNSGNTSAELYDRGIECLRGRLWEEAIAAFRGVIQIEPGHEGAWEKLKEAEREFRKCEDCEDLYRKGKAHFDQEQWEAAVSCLRRLTDPGEPYKNAADLLAEAEKQLRLQTLYANAEVQLNEKKWEEAIKSLQEIVSIDPAYGGSEGKLGQARAQHKLQSLYEQAVGYIRGERWSQAIRVLEMIHKDDPDYLDVTDRLEEAHKQKELAALYSAAVGHQETGRWEEAIDEFREIIHRVRVYKDVVNRLVEVQRRQELARRFEQGEDCLRQRKWEGAVKEFEQVYAVDPNYRDVQVRLEEAKKQFHLEDLRIRGETNLHDENWQEAIEVLEELRKLDPINGSVVAKLEEAKRQLELERSYREGMKYLQKGKWRKAESALEKVIALQSDYRNAAALSGTARQHLNRRNRIIVILSHPIMQGIGVIIALVALAATLYTLFQPPPTPAPPTVAPKPPTLCNGSFEERNLDCWQHGGELRQDVECEGGQCYAVLGSPDYKCEGGVPVGEAWIKQSFLVPETVSPTLSLRYRVFSYDLARYDFFQVRINNRPVDRFGNTKWEGSNCNREVWDSDWQSVEFDLSSYVGKSVEVSFYNVNGTHEWWNTWTYIDDIEVQ